jgi:hypothetical protein
MASKEVANSAGAETGRFVAGASGRPAHYVFIFVIHARSQNVLG